MSETEVIEVSDTGEPTPSVWNVANLVYGLHSLAIIVGLAGSASVIGMFLGSVPSIAAVVLNYVMRGDARSSWIDSHYRWQIRTFWFALLWSVTALLLAVTVVGLPLAVVVAVGLTAWLIYRIARGWLRLRDRRPMYA